MRLAEYLKDNGVTCSVKEFILFTGKSRQTIARYYKERIIVIDAYIKQWGEK